MAFIPNIRRLYQPYMSAECRDGSSAEGRATFTPSSVGLSSTFHP